MVTGNNSMVKLTLICLKILAYNNFVVSGHIEKIFFSACVHFGFPFNGFYWVFKFIFFIKPLIIIYLEVKKKKKINYTEH